jgi:murein L,D-transpeptidase YafK
VRARIYAVLFLIILGVAGYFVLPYTPVADYYHAFTSRVSALAGFGSDRIRTRVMLDLQKRLSDAGIAVGAPVFVRAFTGEDSLEVWLRGDDRYYDVMDVAFCTSDDAKGNVGAEGVPVGVYQVSRDTLSANTDNHLEIGLTRLASDDATDARPDERASVPAIVGNCDTQSGIALTNKDIEPVYMLIDAALRAGQSTIPVHIFEKHHQIDDVVELSEDATKTAPAPGLYDVYVAFERSHIPPDVHKSDGRYKVDSGS